MSDPIKVDVIVFGNGEWSAYPRDTEGFSQTYRINEAMRYSTPEAAGMTRVTKWAINGWPEGSKEAVYEL